VARSLVLEEYQPDIVRETEAKTAITDYVKRNGPSSKRDIRGNVTGDNDKLGKYVDELQRLKGQGLVSMAVRSESGLNIFNGGCYWVLRVLSMSTWCCPS
jgi:hypothetical protein